MSRKVMDYFLEMVQIDSESLYEGAMVEYLRDELERLGAEIYIDEANKVTGGETGNLIAWIEGEPEKEPLLLCAHLDTVKPGRGIVPVIDGDRVRSAGITILGADDKCGIAMILSAVSEYLSSGKKHASLELLFTVSEEIGLLGAKQLDCSLLRAKRGYVLDGNILGEVVTAAPSQSGWTAKFTGRAAHAGLEPEKGINAIRAAAAAIGAIPDGRIDEETTMNVGMIAGGKATNIVCEEVTVLGEIRSHNEAKLAELERKVKEQFEAAASGSGCELDFQLAKSFSAIKIKEEDELIKISEAAFASIGITHRLVVSGGGSDANILAEKGIQLLIVGPGMQNIHSTAEFILTADLEKGRDWVAEIIELWSR